MSLKTQQEARECWCPLATPVEQIESHTGHRTMRSRSEDGRAMLACRCIASACMAWRIGEHARHTSECASVRTQCDATPERCDCELVPARGFCGLAGRPE